MAALVADVVVDMSRAVFRQKDPLTIAIVPLTFTLHPAAGAGAAGAGGRGGHLLYAGLDTRGEAEMTAGIGELFWEFLQIGLCSIGGGYATSR